MIALLREFFRRFRCLTAGAYARRTVVKAASRSDSVWILLLILSLRSKCMKKQIAGWRWVFLGGWVLLPISLSHMQCKQENQARTGLWRLRFCECSCSCPKPMHVQDGCEMHCFVPADVACALEKFPGAEGFNASSKNSSSSLSSNWQQMR